jgi:hypothetical protein
MIVNDVTLEIEPLKVMNLSICHKKLALSFFARRSKGPVGNKSKEELIESFTMKM